MINYKVRIIESGKTIYDVAESINGDSLFIPTDELCMLLKNSLIGMNLQGLAIKTRSRKVKDKICEVLGYKIPKSFKRTHPKFPAQNFDVYIQESNNVQIWNEEVDFNRRYVIIQVNKENHTITNVKIINGDQLFKLDTTGTLTSKYQATMNSYGINRLFSENDTKRVQRWCDDKVCLNEFNPNGNPFKGGLLPIAEIYARLLSIQGMEFPYLGSLQERKRGAGLHSVICKKLGFTTFEDDGAYPDIMQQLIEIKLQTSQTIDLGLHSPADDSTIFSIDGQPFRSRDVRYVIADSVVIDDLVRVNNLYVINGKDFTEYFPLFGGKVKNAKRQLLLPIDFFT
jgi:hypothetical protein